MHFHFKFPFCSDAAGVFLHETRLLFFPIIVDFVIPFLVASFYTTLFPSYILSIRRDGKILSIVDLLIIPFSCDGRSWPLFPVCFLRGFPPVMKQRYSYVWWVLHEWHVAFIVCIKPDKSVRELWKWDHGSFLL